MSRVRRFRPTGESVTVRITCLAAWRAHPIRTTPAENEIRAKLPSREAYRPVSARPAMDAHLPSSCVYSGLARSTPRTGYFLPAIPIGTLLAIWMVGSREKFWGPVLRRGNSSGSVQKRSLGVRGAVQFSLTRRQRTRLGAEKNAKIELVAKATTVRNRRVKVRHLDSPVLFYLHRNATHAARVYDFAAGPLARQWRLQNEFRPPNSVVRKIWMI